MRRYGALVALRWHPLPDLPETASTETDVSVAFLSFCGVIMSGSEKHIASAIAVAIGFCDVSEFLWRG